LEEHLKWLYRKARIAEEAIRADGWRFDTKNKKVVEIQERTSANRPTHFLNRAIGLAYDFVCKERGLKGNTQQIRELVQAKLTVFFPEQHLDPGYRGPVWNAILNWTRK
jgi:hypothetical protein